MLRDVLYKDIERISDVKGRRAVQPTPNMQRHISAGNDGPATGGGFRHGIGAGPPAVASPASLRSLTRTASRTATRRKRSRDRNDEDSQRRSLGPRDRRDVADVLEDVRADMIQLNRVVRSHAQAIAANNDKITAIETTMESYRNGCAMMEVNISTLDSYAQAVDARLTDVLNKATIEFRGADARVKLL